MLKIEENYSLKNLNTFGFDIKAKYFIKLTSIEEVDEFFVQKTVSSLRALNNFLILGGGSNLLFKGNFEGLIIQPEILGIEITKDTPEFTYVRCGAGVVWDKFVEWTVDKNLGGIENLSNIPGTVGASPVQNIGAYGVEVKDCLESVEGYRLEDGTYFNLSNNDCKLGYRTSIFKTLLKDKIVIAHVNFRLTKKPVFKTTYGSLTAEIAKLGILNLNNIRQAVINIRSEKLPDPSVIGNAGSFFKNPLVTKEIANQIKGNFPEMQIFSANDGNFKIPAAFLIEKCGWKGFRDKDAGVHVKQPLVLVNYGNAKGSEIFKLAQLIKKSVKDKFSIDLEMEVNVV